MHARAAPPIDQQLQPIPRSLLLIHLILALIVVIPSFSALLIGCNRFYLVNSAWLATGFLIIHLGALVITQGICIFNREKYLDYFYIGLYVLFFFVGVFVFWAFLVSVVGIYCENEGWHQRAQVYPAPVCHSFSMKTYGAGTDRRSPDSSTPRHDCTFHYDADGYEYLRRSGLTINSFTLIGALLLSPLLLFELLLTVSLHKDLRKARVNLKVREDKEMQMSSLDGISVTQKPEETRKNRKKPDDNPGPATSYENPNHDLNAKDS